MSITYSSDGTKSIWRATFSNIFGRFSKIFSPYLVSMGQKCINIIDLGQSYTFRGQIMRGVSTELVVVSSEKLEKEVEKELGENQEELSLASLLEKKGEDEDTGESD